MRAVYKSELGHLSDVVIFPSKGSYPLAAKLQGGDYDGDTVNYANNSSLVSSANKGSSGCVGTPC